VFQISLLTKLEKTKISVFFLVNKVCCSISQAKKGWFGQRLSLLTPAQQYLIVPISWCCFLFLAIIYSLEPAL